MREIEFRAWNKKEKFMDSAWLIDWEHGKVCHSKQNQSELEDCTLLQYTGLKDKNGVGIYEKDIVIYQFMSGNESGTIVYKNGGFKVKSDYFFSGDGTRMGGNEYYEIDRFTCLEVVGNIYQNLELIES